MYGTGYCPKLADVWCKDGSEGVCQDKRTSNKEWAFLDRQLDASVVKDICKSKYLNKNETPELITGDGLCPVQEKDKGYYCIDNKNKCHDWNTYNSDFIKKNTFEEHKSECDKIEGISGYGTCEYSELEDVYCYDKSNNICYDKYSEENDFYPKKNRYHNSINNCLNNYSEDEKKTNRDLSNHGNCKDKKPNSVYK